MLNIGGKYTCIENGYKSKVIIDIINSNVIDGLGWDSRVVVYHFWNQVGTKPYFMSYTDFKLKHKKEN